MDTIQIALAAVPGLLPHRTIRYQQDSYYSDIEATVGSTRMDYIEEHGVRARTEIRNYLIKPVNLVINSVQVKPKEGDLIIDTNEGMTRTYQVMVEAGTAWRYTDRYHTMFRVYVKQIDEAAL